MSTILYVEGSAGASGDMLLSALLDLGFPPEKLKEVVRGFPVPISFSGKSVKVDEIAARQIIPIVPKTNKRWRLDDFLEAVQACTLTKKMKKSIAGILAKLAEAEGKVHRKSPREIHFRELGGWDTLFDVAGVMAGFEFFNPSVIYAGPLNVGGGFSRSDHGKLSVPPPVVAELLKGFTIHSTGERTELVTPTGALLLSCLAKPVQAIPPMTLQAHGCGAGQKKLSIPNILRIFLGESAAPAFPDLILKIETNVDDMNPQLWENVLEKLYEAGASEAFLTPVIMKKSRPATLLTVLAPPEKEDALIRLLFEETTTIGVRKEIMDRRILNRKTVEIKTSLGRIPCKAAYENGVILNLTPEYDALKKLAREKKIPLKKAYQDVLKEIKWPEKA